MKNKYTYGNELTVGELKKILEDVPDELFVARVGHFGEINTFSKGDFHIRRSDGNYPYMVPVNGSWRSSSRKPMDILNVYVPDIGGEPD